jgi:endonuclease YncB( thermonuclease family)
VRAINTHRRNVFTAVLAVAWLGIVGLLTFVFPASNRYAGRVVAISESAQVVVLRDGRPQSLRLAEVDFPEKGHFRARASRAFANRLALGRNVEVEESRLADGTRLGYVTLPGGRSLSAELVKAGLAWPSALRPGRLAPSLAVLQTRAMSDRRGLWAGAGRQPVLSAARTSRVSSSNAVVSEAVDADADADLDETEAAPAAEELAAKGAAGAALGEN